MAVEIADLYMGGICQMESATIECRQTCTKANDTNGYSDPIDVNLVEHDRELIVL